jgi:hypothetical protein
VPSPSRRFQNRCTRVGPHEFAVPLQTDHMVLRSHRVGSEQTKLLMARDACEVKSISASIVIVERA